MSTGRYSGKPPLVPELHLRNDQRVGAIGRTGSGKTFVMERLLREQPRVIVVDSKHRVNFPGYSMTHKANAALLDDKTIYRHEGKVPDSFWEDALHTLHDEGGGILYVDELAEITSPAYAPAGLKTILRLGRELGVGLWWSAQSATEIFNTAIRQADVMLLFLNVGASDRDKVIKTAGDLGEVTKDLDLYEFVVFESADTPPDMGQIPVYQYDAAVEERVTERVSETETVAA